MKPLSLNRIRILVVITVHQEPFSSIRTSSPNFNKSLFNVPLVVIPIVTTHCPYKAEWGLRKNQ